MTPEQALDLLDKATGTVQTTREGHTAIQQALEVLRKLITPNV